MSDVATNSKALMEATKAEVMAIRVRLEKLYFKLDDLDYDTMTPDHADALVEVKNNVSSASDFMRDAIGEFRD